MNFGAIRELLPRPGVPSKGSDTADGASWEGQQMNSIIYLVGLVVVVMAVLSLIGLR